MKPKRRKSFRNIGCFIIILLVIGGVIALSINYIVNPPPGVSSTSPKLGYWQGNRVNFVVTSDGKINDFTVNAANTQLVYCSWGWQDGPQLENNRFEKRIMSSYSENSVTGYYATDNKFHGDYHLQICGQWILSKGSAKEGSWEAEWVAGSKPKE